MNDLNSTNLILGFFSHTTWDNIDAIMSILGTVGIILTAVLYAMSKYKVYKINKRKQDILKNEYILVCGLGENNRIYIDSEIKNNFKDIIIIEKNKNNPYIQHYIDKGVSVIIADATDIAILKMLNIFKSKYIIISTNNDMINLEIATQILLIDEDIKLYVHIEDRSLRHFHKENGILKNSNSKLYSYNEDASREVFEVYDIDGNDNKIIDSKDNFVIVIMGNTNLAYEVVSQACIMGQLPNENKLTIYCIDKDIDSFKNNIELNYTQIQNVPNITIKYISLDINSKDCYLHSLWKENITNIILCFKNSQTNLDIASNLSNITYLEQIADNTFTINIIIAMFNEYNLSNIIKDNNTSFSNFYIFGNINNICDKKYIIEEQRDKRAIATNEVYNENIKETNPKKVKKWEERSYFEQESNRASSDHIKIKQKYLKLYSIDNVIEKLAKCEHNRWNAYHFLNGWKFSKEIVKEKKLHNCLVNYNELSEDIKDYDREMVSNIEKIIGGKN